MMASLRESKKSLRACPCSFIFPMIKPKHIENTTRPRALTPLVAPGRGITSSWAISWVALVRLNIESFTITFTWMILLPYWVLNYMRKKRRRELVLKMSKNQSDLRINFIWSCSYHFDLGIWIARNIPQPWFRESHFSICLKYVIFLDLLDYRVSLWSVSGQTVSHCQALQCHCVAISVLLYPTVAPSQLCQSSQPVQAQLWVQLKPDSQNAKWKMSIPYMLGPAAGKMKHCQTCKQYWYNSLKKKNVLIQEW